MRYLRILAVIGVLMIPAGFAQAQHVAVGVGIGVPAPVAVAGPPVCAYGYYSYYPYACAPYGYYGPDWFSGGVFIGAGPWYHGFYGRAGYYGHAGFYGRPGYYGHPFYRQAPVVRGPAFRGSVARGPAFRGSALRGGRRR
jgi:hypothetical protein